MFHHSEDNKKPSAFPLSQTCQSDTVPYSWPFKSNLADSKDVMRFNGTNGGVPLPPPPLSSSPIPSTSGVNLMNHPPPRVKRKIDDPNYFPNKQLITEEKMIRHLHGLHISNEFQAHAINLEDIFAEEEMEASYTVNLTPAELQQRLKNAQCIELHEDIKKSLKESYRSEIYKVLSNRIEKPCQALVLWQPPTPLDRLLTNFKSTSSSDTEDECEKMLE